MPHPDRALLAAPYAQFRRRGDVLPGDVDLALHQDEKDVGLDASLQLAARVGDPVAAFLEKATIANFSSRSAAGRGLGLGESRPALCPLAVGDAEHLGELRDRRRGSALRSTA
jgi:hypothetical protein